MVQRMAKLILKAIFILPIDIVVATAITLYNMLLSLALRIRRNTGNRTALAFISCGCTVELTLRKFGAMDYIYDFDGRADSDTFDTILHLWFPSHGNNLRIEVKNRIFIERRMKLFLFSCMAYFFTSVLNEAKTKNIALVRATDPYLVGFCGFVLSKLLRCPLLVSIHSNYDKRFELDGERGVPIIFWSWRLTRLVERLVLRNARMTTTYCRDWANWLNRHGVADERIAIIPRYINLSPARIGPKTNFRDRFHLPKDKHIISFAGRFSRENYIFDVLSLSERMLDRNDWVLVLAGGGVYELDMDQILSCRPELKQRVINIGRLSHQDVWELRFASDIAICLMGGFSLIESCAAGCATIAYDVEWHSDLIEHGRTGILVKEFDIDDLESNVRTLLSNDRIRNELGLNAKERVFIDYDESTVNAARRGLYSQLIREYNNK